MGPPRGGKGGRDGKLGDAHPRNHLRGHDGLPDAGSRHRTASGHQEGCHVGAEKQTR